MTDKEKIREEIEIVVNRRLNLLNGDYFDLNKEADGFTNEIMDIIYSLQEEPNKLKFNVGDTIKYKDGYEVTIESIGDDCYFVDRAQACIKFSTQDQWELVEEHVNEDLGEASKHYALNNTPWDDCKKEIQEAFVAGAQWNSLTSEDMKLIYKISDEIPYTTEEDFYKEMLKRFNEEKYG